MVVPLFLPSGVWCFYQQDPILGCRLPLLVTHYKFFHLHLSHVASCYCPSPVKNSVFSTLIIVILVFTSSYLGSLPRNGYSYFVLRDRFHQENFLRSKIHRQLYYKNFVIVHLLYHISPTKRAGHSGRNKPLPLSDLNEIDSGNS